MIAIPNLDGGVRYMEVQELIKFQLAHLDDTYQWFLEQFQQDLTELQMPKVNVDLLGFRPLEEEMFMVEEEENPKEEEDLEGKEDPEEEKDLEEEDPEKEDPEEEDELEEEEHFEGLSSENFGNSRDAKWLICRI